jgi:ABC-type glycerol-3-phosphate transport system substrate-binding protein
MKKPASLILILIILGAITSGCGVETGEHEVNVYVPDYMEGYFRSLTKSIALEYPEIKLSFKSVESDYDSDVFTEKVNTILISSDRIDLVISDNMSLPVYVKNGVLTPLDGYIAKDAGFNINDIFESLVKSAEYDDELYSLPIHSTAFGLWYNKSLFDKYRLREPAPDWTWDMFIDSCNIIINGESAESNKKLYAFPRTEMYYWPVFSYMKGALLFSEDGKYADIKDNTVLASIELENDLINKYKIISGQVETLNSREQFDKFLNGDYIFLPSSGITPEIAKSVKNFTGFSIGITTFPEFDEEKGFFPQNNSFIGISKKSRNPEDAWKVISFILSQKGQELQLLDMKLLPASIPAFDKINKNLQYEGILSDEEIMLLQYIVMHSKNVRTFHKYQIAMDFINKELEFIYQNNFIIRDRIDGISNDINLLLNEN